MSDSSLKILRRYHYDPLDRLTGVGLLAGDSTQRFYQENHLATELGQQTQRTILRHEAQPLAQQQNEAGVKETTLLATDRAHSLLHCLAQTNSRRWAYTAYGHHPAESGLSRLLGFNGECPDAITGHYPLGQGNRFFNPVLMRFNSPDELGPFDKEARFNTYAYCNGDPINFYDPTGHTGLFRLWDAPVKASSIAKYSLYKTRRTANSISRSNPSGNPILNTMLNRRISNAGPSATSMSASTSQLAAQPKPNTSTFASQERPFLHPLSETKTNMPKANTPSSNGQRYQELLADARRYDRYKTNNPNFTPTVDGKLYNKWDRYNTLASKSERTTPKLTIAKAKHGLRRTELEIKQHNIRKIDGNTNV